jgi:MipA family protein
LTAQTSGLSNPEACPNMTDTPKTTLARIMTIVAVAPAVIWHGAALAQTTAVTQSQPDSPAYGPSDTQSQEQPDQQGDGPPPVDMHEELPDWLGWIVGPSSPGQGDQFALGIGAAYMPAHIGSAKYRLQVLPAIDIKYGRFFATFQDGIGANLYDSENLTIGAGITMADSYRASDLPQGIGKLSFGIGARGFVTARQFGFEATAGVTKIIAGSTGGVLADFSLSRPIMLSDRVFINPSIGTTWANRRHNNRYFGVSAEQSAASGLAQFSPGSGFIEARAELGIQYRLTERWGIGLMGGVTTVTGDTQDSPIVERKTAPFGIGFISYQF